MAIVLVASRVANAASTALRFTVLKRSEEREHGEYRTKRGVMESCDALAAATGNGTPYHSPLGPPRRAT